MQAYTTLIQKLDYILLSLRYGHDPAWENVYKLQCAQACLDPNGERLASDKKGAKPKRSFLWTWYQTYSERTLALQNLLPHSYSMPFSTHGMLTLELFRYNDYRHGKDSNESSNDKEDIHQHHNLSSLFPSHGGVGGGDSGRVNVHRAMEYANAYYSTLEEKLASLSDDSPHFFGTDKPSYVDALLFAHLAEAICNVHLILVLAKHSRLIRYFQRLYDLYFGKDYILSFMGDKEWITNNNVANACNAYNQIPAAPEKKNAENVPEMSHAIDLMQRLAVHCHQLDEALKDAARLRLDLGEKEVLDSYQRPVGSNLYRYCLKGGFWGSSKKDVDAHDNNGCEAEEEKDDASNDDDVHRKWKAQMEQMKRAERRRDETWIMGVVVAVLGSFLISACTAEHKS